jgi:transcriptional regulator with XRE-family HTH domain
MPTKPDGALIRRLREDKGLKGVELANAAGIDPAMLWRIEHGRLDGSPKTRKAIADALEVPVADITFFTPDTTPGRGRKKKTSAEKAAA